MYSFIIIFWEILFLTAASNLFILLTLDFSRSINFIPILGFASIQYLFCSYISGKVEEGFENVGNYLYLSQWYLLKPEQRKDFLMLLFAQKRKSLTVGPFALCSLERFSKVSCMPVLCSCNFF